jgi:hypothetical protein
MPYPKNPNDIVLKNKYYPSGLKEEQIWKYYQDNKSKILEQTINRNIMLFILLDDGSLVVRKKWNDSSIKLTSSNYDEILSGRSISIHSLMRSSEDIAIVDIDGDNFDKVREATHDVYTTLTTKISFLQKCQIRFTGKTGFHIACYLKRKTNIDSIRTILQKILSTTNLQDKYTIRSKRSSGTPNIDLFSNKLSGGFITLGSLSTIGLRCEEVSLGKLKTFSPNEAKI